MRQWSSSLRSYPTTFPALGHCTHGTVGRFQMHSEVIAAVAVVKTCPLPCEALPAQAVWLQKGTPQTKFHLASRPELSLGWVPFSSDLVLLGHSQLVFFSPHRIIAMCSSVRWPSGQGEGSLLEATSRRLFHEPIDMLTGIIAHVDLFVVHDFVTMESQDPIHPDNGMKNTPVCVILIVSHHRLLNVPIPQWSLPTRKC